MDDTTGVPSAPADQPESTASSEALTATVEVLRETLRALGIAGRPVEASRLAARAWWPLREKHPREAERINGLMHYLAQLPAEPETGKEDTMSEDLTLDVRTEPHMRRHTLIFGAYAKLEPGSAFVLLNDHDPKPLYYQFEAEHKGAFSWDYLEQGPEVWRVRIGRTATA